MRHGLIYYSQYRRDGFLEIHGVIGVRLYLYYSKKEAEHKYRLECEEQINKALGQEVLRG